MIPLFAFTFCMIGLGVLSSKLGFIGKMFAFVFGILAIAATFSAVAIFIITEIGANVA
jgi:hypothetical protein